MFDTLFLKVGIMMLKISNLNTNKSIILDNNDVDMLAHILKDAQDVESTSTYDEANLAWNISFQLDIFLQE